MDGSKEQPQTTAGLDLGDKYSYLCLIDSREWRGDGGGQAAHHPRGFQAALRLRAAAAHSHRGGNPLAVG